MNSMPTSTLQRGLQSGAIAFALLTYLILIGLPIRLGGAAFPILALVSMLLLWALLRRPAEERATRRSAATILASSLCAGLTVSLLTLGLVAIFTTLLGQGVRIQPTLDKVVPLNMASLLGVSAGTVAQGQVPLLAYVGRVAMLMAAGLGAGLLLLLQRSQAARALGQRRLPGVRWFVIALPFLLFALTIWIGQPSVTIGGNNQGTYRLLLALVATGSGLIALRQTHSRRERWLAGLLLAAAAAYLPFTLDQFQNSVMGIVFIFVMMGLGLNIVVGFAGLLDLGYVAFFAIGAYVYAFLSAPGSSPLLQGALQSLGIAADSPLLSFWPAIPMTMAVGGLGGVLLGIPVLRLRGDYLAIVTLGFGEIIRLFMLNLSELTNGPRGLLNIPAPTLLTYNMGNPRDIFILALIGAALVAFVAHRLNHSRLGRAWIAMREDEDVAQATGINLVKTKLLAFAIGAMFAGLAGQLYAARQVNIFPDNFSLFVSIDALSLIIVGGMGSLPGVVLGALALKGLPEVLRGVDEYRIVTFAALLVIMMVVRPEGFLPSVHRRRELVKPATAESPPEPAHTRPSKE